MPHFIVKYEPDLDLYVNWSTVTDSPLSEGTRSDFLEEEPGWGERLDRADEYGSSDRMRWFSWDVEEFRVAEPLGDIRTLPRSRLRAYVDAIFTDNIPAAFALTDPIELD